MEQKSNRIKQRNSENRTSKTFMTGKNDLRAKEVWLDEDISLPIEVIDLFSGCEYEVLSTLANRTFFTVIVYDIADNRRRYKLAKTLLGYGERVQYSGFEAHLTSRQFDKLKSQVEMIIDDTVDRVRLYRIAGKPQVTVFGSIPFFEEDDFTII